MKHLFFSFLCVVLHLGTACGQGTLRWDESVSGPLGNSPSTATSFGTFGLGTNSVFGRSELDPVGESWIGYGDYFTFSVPAGAAITSLLFVSDRTTWIWVGNSTFGNQLGFASNPANGSLLPQLALPNIPAGNYAMYSENHDRQSFPTIANYRLDFIVTAIPEPSTWALFALGSVALWSAARRRRK